jgi:O-acetyl-ADP-ribose deacetylase (regulator of RNase III)
MITINNTLKLADEKGIAQLAFPLMGVGFYGILLNSCINIMIESIGKYLTGKNGLSEVIICANDNREYRFFAEKFANLSKESK